MKTDVSARTQIRMGNVMDYCNMNIFVTLFDSNYLDKGMVLFDSLCENVKSFKLYIVAFDEVCYRVLKNLHDSRLIVISLSEFENEDLRRIKKERTKAEYCWTCSSCSVRYVFETFKETYCTYIDADMFFYCSPIRLFQEIISSQCDVGIMRHGFLKGKESERYIHLAGEFCVEFNFFINNAKGREILDWWCEKSLEKCSSDMDGKDFGDQKYLEEMIKTFTGIHVFKDSGGGVAPWNLGKFRLKYEKSGSPTVIDKEDGNVTDLIFYHFQQMHFVNSFTIDAEIAFYPGKADKRLIKLLYSNYLEKIIKKRIILKEKEGVIISEKHYKEKTTLKDQMYFIFRYENNIWFAFLRIWRFFFRKKYDYVSVFLEGKG